MYITGTFNNWEKQIPMHRSGNDFTYIHTLKVRIRQQSRHTLRSAAGEGVGCTALHCTHVFLAPRGGWFRVKIATTTRIVFN